MAGVFRLVCHTAVVAWLAVVLVLAQFDAPAAHEATPREMQTARVRPVPEPPPRVDTPATPPEPEAIAEPAPPDPEPKPEPGPEPAPEPEQGSASQPKTEATVPARVRPSDLSRGAELLGSGDFPILNCSYESFPSFGAYARAMVSLGARFVVVRRREIVGSIDVASGELAGPRLGAGFSPRARDYTGEVALASLTRRARERHGSGSVVMMLVPRTIDAGLFGGISRLLAERGESHDAYREIRGRYEQAGSGVRLRVDSGIRSDGSRVDMNLLFDLGDISGRGRA